MNGNLETAKIMFNYIQEKKFRTNQNSSLKADQKRTLMHLAARYDSVKILQKLLINPEYKNDINSKDSVLL